MSAKETKKLAPPILSLEFLESLSSSKANSALYESMSFSSWALCFVNSTILLLFVIIFEFAIRPNSTRLVEVFFIKILSPK